MAFKLNGLKDIITALGGDDSVDSTGEALAEIADHVASAETIPTASADTLGGVKVGDGLTITEGVLSADPIPTASADTLGGVKVGDGLTITAGVLSADPTPGEDVVFASTTASSTKKFKLTVDDTGTVTAAEIV